MSLDRFLLPLQAVPNMNSIFCFNYWNKRGTAANIPLLSDAQQLFLLPKNWEWSRWRRKSNGTNLPKVLQVQGRKVAVSDSQPSPHTGKQKWSILFLYSMWLTSTELFKKQTKKPKQKPNPEEIFHYIQRTEDQRMLRDSAAYSLAEEWQSSWFPILSTMQPVRKVFFTKGCTFPFWGEKWKCILAFFYIKELLAFYLH